MSASNFLVAPNRARNPELVAGTLEAAGLSGYLLDDRRAVAATMYPEVRLSHTAGIFALLSLERVGVPPLSARAATDLEAEARSLAMHWGVVWRGSVREGEVEVAFGERVAVSTGEDPARAGFLLHEALVRVHAAHQLFRQRAVLLAWQGATDAGQPA